MSDCKDGGCECCNEESVDSSKGAGPKGFGHACSQKLMEPCDVCGVGPGDLPSKGYLSRVDAGDEGA